LYLSILNVGRLKVNPLFVQDLGPISSIVDTRPKMLSARTRWKRPRAIIEQEEEDERWKME